MCFKALLGQPDRNLPLINREQGWFNPDAPLTISHDEAGQVEGAKSLGIAFFHFQPGTFQLCIHTWLGLGVHGNGVAVNFVFQVKENRFIFEVEPVDFVDQMGKGDFMFPL
jgi:hypothetical protein